MLKVMSDDNCLDATGADSPVKLVRCHGMGGNQAWVYNKQEQSLKHVNTGRCLASQASSPGNPRLERCDGSSGQQWLMQSKYKWQA